MSREFGALAQRSKTQYTRFKMALQAKSRNVRLPPEVNRYAQAGFGAASVRNLTASPLHSSVLFVRNLPFKITAGSCSDLK